MPFVELRASTENGPAPWDGTTMGELEVRGPWVAKQYYNVEGPDDRFTEDGWFRTGDIVTIDPSGCIELTDRAKDLVKSGGEWISSVALETALMGHPCVRRRRSWLCLIPNGTSGRLPWWYSSPVSRRRGTIDRVSGTAVREMVVARCD